MTDRQTDTLIIGSGIAGAAAALRLSLDPNHQVTILTRSSTATSSNSSWAQGGIVTRGLDDSPELLVEDILRAGAGLSSHHPAKILAEEGPSLVQSILVDQCGVQFDRNEQDEYIYGLEGAHSVRRVVHVGDKTGKSIIDGMLQTLSERENVQLLTHHTAVDLITFPHHSLNPLDIYERMACHGAYVLDRNTNDILRIIAGHTILATGGLGQIYKHTTNPRGSRGDGLAMAWRAGVRVVNAEYVQFHPTALSVSGRPNLLISEAVRGEGAVLLTPDGEPFMQRYSPEWKDLAPRDVVARAIHSEMLVNDFNYVLLDIASKRSKTFIENRFPQLIENCKQFSIDPTNEPIPVVPAAHYFCGGVLVDEWGQSNFDGLYAVGEVSCTGLHGANRLASTSLLEGLVWGDRSAQHIQAHRKTPIDLSRIPAWVHLGDNEPDPALIEGDMTTIRNIMWHYVGLIRTDRRLDRADRELRHLFHEIEAFYRTARLNDGLIGLRNAIQASRIITFSARRNPVSRGTHFRADAPPVDMPMGTIISR